MLRGLFVACGCLAAVCNEDVLWLLQHRAQSLAQGQDSMLARFSRRANRSTEMAKVRDDFVPEDLNFTFREFNGTSLCAFSQEKAKYVPWASPKAAHYNAMLSSLSGAGYQIMLRAGTLLGAYRHHGVIPHDGDMDLVLDVCMMGSFFKSLKKDSQFAGKECYQLRELRDSMGLDPKSKKAFHKLLWREVLAPALEPAGIQLVTAKRFGFRVSNAKHWEAKDYFGGSTGVGADLVVQFGHNGDLCTCTFGTASAACPTSTEYRLIEEYGEDFLIPKSACDYYKEIDHADWNHNDAKDCDWARNATALDMQEDTPTRHAEQAEDETAKAEGAQSGKGA